MRLSRVRFTLRGMMVAVAIAAGNIGAARMLYEYDEELAAGVVPSGLLIQFGIIRAIRGEGRAFWIGFAVAAAAVAFTFILTMEGASSAFSPWWGGYIKFAVRASGPLGRAMTAAAGAEDMRVFIPTFSAILTPPPLVIALVAGAVSRGGARLILHRRRVARSPWFPVEPDPPEPE